MLAPRDNLWLSADAIRAHKLYGYTASMVNIDARTVGQRRYFTAPEDRHAAPSIGGAIGIALGALIVSTVRTLLPSIPATLSVVWVSLGGAARGGRARSNGAVCS
jgi:hypothetical protein